MSHAFLQFSPRITVLPVVHGSGDFALEVRRVLLAEKFDCLAVPLPESFQDSVEEAIEALPTPTIVVRSEEAGYRPDAETDDESPSRVSYVPIDPCQPIIAALRFAIQEQLPRAFIDLETEGFHNSVVGLPDPYALKKVAVEKFSAAVLPSLPRPTNERHRERIAWMAHRLRQLERRHQRFCSSARWAIGRGFAKPIPRRLRSISLSKPNTSPRSTRWPPRICCSCWASCRSSRAFTNGLASNWTMTRTCRWTG